MHITNDTLTTTAALTVGIDITAPLLDAWGQGCVELYQAIGEWAQVVTAEEAHLSQALEAHNEGWPGVFAYEVTEAVGAVIRNAILLGDEPDAQQVREATRQHIALFCEGYCDEVKDNYLYRSTLLTR